MATATSGATGNDVADVSSDATNGKTTGFFGW